MKLFKKIRSKEEEELADEEKRKIAFANYIIPFKKEKEMELNKFKE